MSHPNGSKHEICGPDLGRMIEQGQWEKVKELLTPSPEEVEQLLREPMIDAAEVNRMLGITDEEIAETLKSPVRLVLPGTAERHQP